MRNAAPKNHENCASEVTAILAQLELFESEIIPRFAGTSNPRELRVIDALMRRAGILREELDRVAGCSNGPDLVKRLKVRGLDLECRTVESRDRDGRVCWSGWYFFTAVGRRQIIEWRSLVEA